jgi:drug/metabolite transporter (DMT)-like permease
MDPSPSRWRLLLALSAIYVLWGSTYFAIRVAVDHLPPLFAAGIRFSIAGAVLYLWARLRGAGKPDTRQWRNLCLLGGLMFLPTYSVLFWAEKTVPSGIASVLSATLPVWMVVLETVVFKSVRFKWSLLAPILLGLAGVAVLVLRGEGGGSSTVLPAALVVATQCTWASGSVLAQRLRLPDSKTISAGAQMIIGGAMLLASAGVAGELGSVHAVPATAVLAVAYLIVAGSLMAYTAYVWLLDRMPATQVSSYAYVNPVVALLIGYLLGREAFGLRELGGSVLVLGSVAAILKIKPLAR